jgi:Tol biopolymer transport system component
MAVGLIGLLLGGGLLLYWLSPRILAYAPGETAASAAHPIQLNLSRSLNAEFAGKYLQIEPPIDGRIQSDGRFLQFLPDTPWPYGEEINVIVRPGWPGNNGLPLWRGQSWSFTAVPPDLYFATFTAENSQVWTMRLDDAQPVLWFSEQGDIIDMGLTADGRALLLTLLDDNGRTHLIQHNRFPPERRILLTCHDDFCRQPQRQPGGDFIAYERQTPSRTTEVWLLDSRTGQNRPAHSPALFQEPSVAEALATLVSHSPRWSPDGRTLAYFKPDAHLIILLDGQGVSPPAMIPAQLNEMGGWSPQGDSLIYTELTFGDPDFYERWEAALIAGEDNEHIEPGLHNHVVRTDLVSGATVDLSEGLPVDESGLSWSPDGRRLAFSRSYSGAGRQIWLSRPDGDDPTPLTNDPFYHHSAPRWSPDGRYLLFMRSSITPGGEPPAIWLLEWRTGELRLITTGGYLPGWRP